MVFILLGLSILLWIARYVALSSASFIGDEPFIQLMIDRHFHSASWIARFPRTGMPNGRGVLYGPTPLWFYSVPRLFSAHVPFLLAYEVTLWAAGMVLFYLAVRRSEGKKAAAWFTLLISASPYLFLYSRQLWDITLLFPLTGAIVFLLVRLEKRMEALSAAALGLCCGLVVDLHLMALPVAAAAILLFFAACVFKKFPSKASCAASFVAAFALTCLPYLSAVWVDLVHTHQFHPQARELFHFLPRCWLWSGHYLGPVGMDYFIDLRSSWLKPLVSKEITAPFLLIASLFAARVAVRWWRAPSEVSVFAKFQILCWTIFMVYFFGIRPEIENPQYFFPIVTAAPFFLACAASFHGRISRAISGACALLVALNLVWLGSAASSVLKNHGAREDHYGPSVAELERISSAICSDARSSGTALSLDLSAVRGVTFYSFEYLTAHIKGCKARIVPGARSVAQVVYEKAAGSDASLRLLIH